jgi:hypothetical protein
MENIAITTIIWTRTHKLPSRTGKTMRYLIYLLLMVATSLSAGSIQKWVDENGEVHYGDAPPVTTKTENVRVQSAPTNPGKALPRLNQGGDEQQAAGNGGGQQQRYEEQSMIACDNARADMIVIDNNSRIKLQEADGSTRFLTPEEIQKRKNTAQADIKKYCN